MNTLKIALGIAATASGAYALNRVRKRQSQNQFSASNGTSGNSEEDQEKETVKPQNHFITDPITATKHSDNFTPNYQAAAKNVQFHQRGVRHR